MASALRRALERNGGLERPPAWPASLLAAVTTGAPAADPTPCPDPAAAAGATDGAPSGPVAEAPHAPSTPARRRAGA
jgi:hypothetical protein